MTSVKANRFMAIFIGVIMLASMVGFALLQQTPQERPEVSFPSIIDHALSDEERLQILRTGRAIIEYTYPEGCLECEGKKGVYEGFVTSGDFMGYAVLSEAEDENITTDRITMVNGDLIELEEVNETARLRELFCEKAVFTPNICILEGM